MQALSGRGCSEYFGLAFKIHELLTPEIDSGIINEEEENGYDDEDETEHCLPDEDEDMVISEEQIKKTITCVENIVVVTEHILRLGENLRFNSNYVTLLKSALCLLACRNNSPSPDATTHLTTNLSAYKMEIVCRENCLLTILFNALSDVWSDELQGVFGPIDSLSLRTLVIQELHENQDAYSKFMLNEQRSFSDELLRLESSVTVTSELLNCIPLALSNCLRIPVIIFTGMLNFPIVPLVPCVPLVSSQPVHIAYDSFVVQFFNVRKIPEKVKPFNAIRSHLSDPDATRKPCRCGTGASKAKDSSSCVGIKCKCSASGNSCENCRCLNCANPFGKRVEKSPSSRATISRKRRRHFRSNPKTDLQFLSKSTKEEMPRWDWELFEKILLIELTRENLESGDLDVIGLCEVISKLRQGLLRDKLVHDRNVEEIRKQIFAAVGIDSAYKTQLREQLRINCM